MDACSVRNEVNRAARRRRRRPYRTGCLKGKVARFGARETLGDFSRASAAEGRNFTKQAGAVQLISADRRTKVFLAGRRGAY